MITSRPLIADQFSDIHARRDELARERDNFVKYLALLAAGEAAKPEQIAAFERYYDRNSPATFPLVAVDEIFICGHASRSTRVAIDILKGSDVVQCLSINAFGGILRWVATPDQKIVSAPTDFRWNITFPDRAPADLEWNQRQMQFIRGHISYIDDTGLRISKPLVNAVDSL